MAVPENALHLEARVNKKTMKKNLEKPKDFNKKILLVAHEIKLTRILAGNSKVSRDRALKSLKKWFQHRSKTMPFAEEDLLRIWKGLFYSMWMSDKPLVQEECAEGISNLVHFPTVSDSMQFFKAGLVTLSNEWFGIDQLRLDKFLMFVRRFLRQALVVLKNNNWKKVDVESFNSVLSETILNTKKDVPLGLFSHFTEIYWEEIAKVSEGKIHSDRITDLIEAYIRKLICLTDGRQIGHIRKYIFTHLIVQSELGIEYLEKYKAWKAEGFPGSIDCMQKIKIKHQQMQEQPDVKIIQDEMGDKKPLDPRAGRVDVELPLIKFNAKAIAQALINFKFDESSNPKTRKIISSLADQFTKLANGVYPLGVKNLNIKSDNYDTNIRKAVNRLVKFDRKIMGQNKKIENKKKKRTSEVLNEMEEESSEAIMEENMIKKKKKEIKQEELDLQQFIEKSEGNLEVHVKRVKKRKNISGNELKTAERKRLKIEEYKLNNVENNRMKKKKKLTNNAAILSDVNTIITRPYVNLDRIECVFERNSGTWVVFTEDSSKQKEVKNNLSFNDSFNEVPLGDLFKAKTESLKTPTKKVGRPKIKTDVKLLQGSTTYQTENNSESKKNNSYSLNEDFLINSSPIKKVKINTKLNKSQEFDEHHAQILSSPGIPFDASKKPSKPLLKVRASTSPINPFYKLN